MQRQNESQQLRDMRSRAALIKRRNQASRDKIYSLSQTDELKVILLDALDNIEHAHDVAIKALERQENNSKPRGAL